MEKVDIFKKINFPWDYFFFFFLAFLYIIQNTIKYDF